MANKDTLSDRMKRYENINRNFLTPKTPVIIRLDGKAFHTFTKGFQKPFDDKLTKAMQQTMMYLCKNIQGCVFGYTQSDEITLVLIDYKNIESSGWFNYNIQKMSSIAASMATMAFNTYFQNILRETVNINDLEMSCYWDKKDLDGNDEFGYYKQAIFDARCFNIPKEDVGNCLLWRQNDAIRNSISALGCEHFSFKELQHKTCSEMKKMLIEEKGIDWDLLPLFLQRGSCCIKEKVSECKHLKWVIDEKIPIFKNEGMEYINKFVYNLV